MGWFTASIKRSSRTRWFAWLGSRTAPRIDRLLNRVTGGRVATARLARVPALMLTTVGRRTGQQRTTPLLYVREGTRFIVAGTNWGQPKEPDWALNLQANPKAWVQVGTERGVYRARVASEEEELRLWPELQKIWPAYETYRERSGRKVNVFVLEPTEEG
jgi:deazaflavin-dependent oxidoreductase (nitroreductase family)